MSAAVSATGTDPSRRISSRYQVGLGQTEFSHGAMGQDAAGIQAGLFEQILSLPVPIETDFQGSSDDWAARAGASHETQSKSENESSEDPQTEESVSSEENEELAASVAAVDQAVPLVGLEEEPTAEDAEVTLQVQDEGEAEDVPQVRNGDLTLDDQAEAEAGLQQGEENGDAQVVDEALGDSQADEDLATDSGAELFEDALDSDAAARQAEDDQQVSAARREIENLSEDPSAANETDGNEKVDETQDADSQAAVSETEGVSEDGGNRRDSRDRKEKWFEKDASEQAEAREAARAGEDKQSLSVEERAAQAKDQETQEIQQPIAAETPKPADEAVEAAIQNIELPSPSLAVAREAMLPAGFTTTDSDAADRGPQNISGLGRAAEKPGAAPTTGGNKPATPGESADLTQQERVRLVQRVARSFARIGPEGGQINLRLHPPQLGSLNVQVRLEGRSMTANLTTENGAAREAILESLPVLRSRLSEQGFEISQFQVDVASNGSDASQGDGHNPTLEQGPRDRDSQLDYRRSARADARLAEAEQASNSTAEHSLVWQTHTGIDLHA